MARYIFQIAGEGVVEAESVAEAKRKSEDDENYIEYSLKATSTPMPEDLLYSMDIVDVPDDEEEE